MNNLESSGPSGRSGCARGSPRRGLPGEPPPRRIVVVRALPGLGDFLCCVPAWRALRAAYPDAKITLVGLPQVRGLVERFHAYLDNLLEFPGYPGIAERPPNVRRLPAFLQAVHEVGFDLALQMHGSGVTSNPFTVLLGARITAGFYLPSQYCPDEATFFPYPEDEPEIRRNLLLVEQLGIPTSGPELEFPLLPADHDSYERLRKQVDLEPGNYACIHPGARDAVRRWSTAHFAQVADALAEAGLQVVLTGTPAEAGLTQAVREMMIHKALDLTGATDLGALAVLLAKSRLLVCNDTGVSHLAAAVHTPSVVIFSASDPVRWAPLDTTRHRALAPRRSTWARVPHTGQVAGPVIEPVTPAEVLREAHALLDSRAAALEESVG